MLFVRATTFITLAALASAGSVLDFLDGCWDDCSNSASQGGKCDWYDVSCICDLADDTSYLADTVTCAKQNCDSFSPRDADRFISPIDFTCSLVGGVKQSRIDAAQAAARADDHSGGGDQPSSAHHGGSKPSMTEPPTTIQTTLRATATNSKGSSIVVDQPMQYGPSGVSSGVRSTIIITSSINVIPVPVSSKSTPTSDAGSTIGGGLLVATGTPSFSGSLPTTAGAPSSSSSSSSHSDGGNEGSLFDSQGSGADDLVAPRGAVALAIALAAPAVLALFL